MEEKLTTQEQLISSGIPIEKLCEKEGFSNLNQFKETLNPIDEITKTEAFKNLSEV